VMPAITIGAKNLSGADLDIIVSSFLMNTEKKSTNTVIGRSS